MPHLSQDELVLLAFGEQPETDTAIVHVADCAHCQAELEVLKQVAELGRETDQVRDLPAPPEHVWEAIASQTGLAGPVPGKPIVQKAPWLKLALAGAAAVLVVALGIWAGLRPVTPQVLASAQLAAFGNTPAQARGSAQVIGDGRLKVSVNDLPTAGAGYYEVWLIDPETLQMFSVGVLGHDPAATFTLPPNVDLARYKVVDVSIEEFDNRPAHSGNSLLRGVLT